MLVPAGDSLPTGAVDVFAPYRDTPEVHIRLRIHASGLAMIARGDVDGAYLQPGHRAFIGLLHGSEVQFWHVGNEPGGWSLWEAGPLRLPREVLALAGRRG